MASRVTGPSRSLALLRDLARPPDRSKWHYAVTCIEPSGRVSMAALGPAACEPWRGAVVAARTEGPALVLRRSGPGAPTPIDARSRFAAPMWLRQAVAPNNGVLLATSLCGSTALVLPSAVIDGLITNLIEEER